MDSSIPWTALSITLGLLVPLLTYNSMLDWTLKRNIDKFDAERNLDTLLFLLIRKKLHFRNLVLLL